jgi:aldehyde:ferredoxin oxidoreductase
MGWAALAVEYARLARHYAGEYRQRGTDASQGGKVMVIAIIVSALAALTACGFTAAYLTARHASALTRHVLGAEVAQQELVRLGNEVARLTKELANQQDISRTHVEARNYWCDLHGKVKAENLLLAKAAKAWKRPPRQSATSKGK